MEIRDVRITKVEMVRKDPAWRTARYAATETGYSSISAFVLSAIADGIEGIGATAAHLWQIQPDELERQLNGPVRAALEGADALNGNAIHRRLTELETHPRARLGADLLIQDLAAKRAGLPCHALWGGALKDEIKVVRMVGIKSPAELVGFVGGLVKEGYDHFKVKIGTGVAEDLARVKALRDAFGGSIWIGVDGNDAYTVEEAIQLSRTLEPFDIAVIEQPVPWDDLDGLAKVTAASAIPIMVDDYVGDSASALEVCRRKAAHVATLKLGKAGSTGEFRRAAELCREFGVGVHIGGSVYPRAVDSAQVQLAATIPGVAEECEVAEFLAVEGDPLTGLPVVDGRIRISGELGLGVSFAAVRAAV